MPQSGAFRTDEREVDLPLVGLLRRRRAGLWKEVQDIRERVVLSVKVHCKVGNVVAQVARLIPKLDAAPKHGDLDQGWAVDAVLCRQDKRVGGRAEEVPEHISSARDRRRRLP